MIKEKIRKKDPESVVNRKKNGYEQMQHIYPKYKLLSAITKDNFIKTSVSHGETTNH